MAQRSVSDSQSTDIEPTLEHAVRRALHDIQSPLSALNALIRSLPHTTEEQRQLLCMVSGRLSEIIGDLNNYQRAPSHQESQRPVRHQGAQFLSEILRAITSEKRIEHSHSGAILIINDCSLGVDESGTERPLALSPNLRVSLQRVLSNLVNNSVEAGSQNIFLRTRCQNGYVVIAVEDDGAGIPPEMLKRLNDGETLSHGKSVVPNGLPRGKGIGMDTARAFVHQLNGRLIIQSEVHHGTLVALWLPVSLFSFENG